MEFITIDGGLFQVLDEYADVNTKTQILWPVDDRARAVRNRIPFGEEPRDKQRRRKRRRKY
jgi:hypothetical protein